MGERSGAPSGFSPASIVISKPPVAVQLPQPDASANRDAPHALHDNDDRSGALIVKTRKQSVFEPFVGGVALGLGIGVVGLEGIVDDDDLAATAGQCATDR